MEAPLPSVKDSLLEVLDSLPPERQAEVLDFALYLKQKATVEPKAASGIVLRTAPASHLKSLLGLISIGGDALEDTERLYDGE